MLGWLFSKGAELLKPVGEFLGNKVLSPIKDMVLESGRDMLRDSLKNLSGQIKDNRFDTGELFSKARDRYASGFKRRAANQMSKYGREWRPQKKIKPVRFGPQYAINESSYLPKRYENTQMEEEEEDGGGGGYQPRNYEEEED